MLFAIKTRKILVVILSLLRFLTGKFIASSMLALVTPADVAGVTRTSAGVTRPTLSLLLHIVVRYCVDSVELT